MTTIILELQSTAPHYTYLDSIEKYSVAAILAGNRYHGITFIVTDAAVLWFYQQ